MSGTSVTCPYCEGRGCSECDSTGERYAEQFTADGITISAHGSGAGLTAEGRDALVAVAKAALKHMDETRREAET